MTERERAIFVFPMANCVLDMKSDAPRFHELQLDDLEVFSSSVADSEVRFNNGILSLGSFSIVLRGALCAFSFGRFSPFSIGTCMSTAVDSDDKEG